MPRDASEGDEVISGCINMTGVLRIKTTKEFGSRRFQDSGYGERKLKKVPFRELYFKFEQYYTPAVCYGALALVVLSADCRCFMVFHRNEEWIMRALTFLVISRPLCPCYQYSISFFTGIGGASNAGVLVRVPTIWRHWPERNMLYLTRQVQ